MTSSHTVIPSTPGEPALTRWIKPLLWVIAASALVGVFALYQNPQLMVTIADQLWSCF
jgi:hypothetical protein